MWDRRYTTDNFYRKGQFNVRFSVEPLSMGDLDESARFRAVRQLLLAIHEDTTLKISSFADIEDLEDQPATAEFVVYNKLGVQSLGKLKRFINDHLVGDVEPRIMLIDPVTEQKFRCVDFTIQYLFHDFVAQRPPDDWERLKGLLQQQDRGYLELIRRTDVSRERKAIKGHSRRPARRIARAQRRAVTLLIDYENSASEWWELGGLELWQQYADNADEVELSDYDVGRFLSRAKRIPGWSDGPDYAPNPIFINETTEPVYDPTFDSDRVHVPAWHGAEYRRSAQTGPYVVMVTQETWTPEDVEFGDASNHSVVSEDTVDSIRELPNVTPRDVRYADNVEFYRGELRIDFMDEDPYTGVRTYGSVFITGEDRNLTEQEVEDILRVLEVRDGLYRFGTARMMRRFADQYQQEAQELLKTQSPRRIPNFGYSGDLDDTWAFTVSVHRDSDSLQRSNFTVILNDMESRFPDDVDVVRAGHWAVGWIEHLAVRMVDDTGQVTPAGEAIIDWNRQLDNYPAANEDHWSQLQADEAEEFIDREIKEITNGIDLIRNLTEQDYEDIYQWLDENTDAIDYIYEDPDRHSLYRHKDDVVAALDALGLLDPEA